MLILPMVINEKSVRTTDCLRRATFHTIKFIPIIPIVLVVPFLEIWRRPREAFPHPQRQVRRGRARSSAAAAEQTRRTRSANQQTTARLPPRTFQKGTTRGRYINTLRLSLLTGGLATCDRCKYRQVRVLVCDWCLLLCCTDTKYAASIGCTGM